MRIYLIMLVFFVGILTPLYCFAQPEQEAAVSPIGVLGEISSAQKTILYNRFQEGLSKYFKIVPQTQFEKARKEAFKVLEVEKCTVDSCIRKVLEFLQVENMFSLQLVREEEFTQLSLILTTMEEKKVVTDLCEKCDIGQLNTRIVGLVDKIVQQEEITKEKVIDPVEEARKKKLTEVTEAIEKHSQDSTEAGELVEEYTSSYGIESLSNNLELTPNGQYNLGLIYRKGYGIEKNIEQAVFWY